MSQSHAVAEAEDNNSSTQFLQTLANHFINLQKQFERYYDTLQVFVFNSLRYDIKLIKSYRLSVVVSEQKTEPTVINKTNRIVSFIASH